MSSIEPIKRTFVMSHILRMAAVGIGLAFAAAGVAQARPISYQHQHFPVYSSTPRALWPWNVPGRSGAGSACDMPDSTCSNNERIND
jgi:hypothetical protein